jgi:DNA-directed RNA polymerase specialized sigma24 family protein
MMNQVRTLPDTCQAIVDQLIARHGWALLDAAEYGRRLQIRVQAVWPAAAPNAAPELPDAETLTKLAVNLYCEVWYEACAGAGERRLQAYSELARYLYDRALYKVNDGDAAQEITHEAILLVADQLPNCRNPGAFMAFALLKLWNASTAYFRARDLLARQTLAMPGGGDEEPGGDLPDRTAVTPEDAAVRSEIKDQLMARFVMLMLESPRARNQLLAVLLKFMSGLSDEEIAAELATDVPSVHVLRSRGLKRLREDGILRDLFRAITGE